MKTVFLKDICEFEKGSTGLAKAIPGNYPLVTTARERRTCESFQFDTKAVCIPLVSSSGHGHASLKNVHYQEGKFALGSILVALTAINEDILDIQFLHLYLSELKDKILVPLMSGAANVALSVTKIKNIKITLPSISRQREIVVQFKSIASEDKELRQELTYQQTLLKKLRQQILQEAIEGKLTKNWRKENPDVEPASELLKRIQKEKEQLIKDKKIKPQKPLPPITENEIPFALPDGWVWTQFPFIYYVIGNRSNQIKKKEYLVTGKCPVIDQGKNFIAGYHDNPDKLLSIKNPVIVFGDHTKNIKYIDFNFIIGADGVKVLNPYSPIYSKFMYFAMRNFRLEDRGYSRHFKVLNKHLFPLPPLAEQKEIVAKVEKLLVLCDQLEAQITSNQTHAEQLMQAVLKEAFSQQEREIKHVN